jgi:hypothetical protein
LDVTFYGQLKAAFHRESDLFISTKSIGEIKSVAWLEISTMFICKWQQRQKRIPDFKAIGIIP